MEKLFSVSYRKSPFGKLALVFEEYIAIGHALIVEGEIIDVVDPLNIHGEPLKSVGQFARYRLAIEAAHLLEIGELRHFHAVAPDFPAKTPGAKRRRFPVIRSEEHTSELQSLMRNSYAVFCLKTKTKK